MMGVTGGCVRHDRWGGVGWSKIESGVGWVVELSAELCWHHVGNIW